jgi:hypothetical protein
MFSKVAKMLTRERDHHKAMQQGAEEAENFKLAPEGGLVYAVKIGVFILLGVYNFKLFYSANPGWLGALTGVIALSVEGLALYCLTYYTRSAGAHKMALGFFAIVLTLFSLVHASLSYFHAERSARWHGVVAVYAESVAFPLLLTLLLLASAILRLTHFRQRVSEEQAKAMVRIQTNRARLLAEGAALRDEAALEQERLNHLEEQIRLEGDYLTGLEKFVQLKEREQQIIARISDPDLREQIARGIGANPKRPALLSRSEGKEADGPKFGRWGNKGVL